MTTATADLQAHRLPCPGRCDAGLLTKSWPDEIELPPEACPECDAGATWFVGFSERCPDCDGVGGDVLVKTKPGVTPARVFGLQCKGSCADRPSWLEPGRVALGCPRCGGSMKLGHFHEQGVCPCRDGYLVVEITREEADAEARTALAQKVANLLIESERPWLLAAALRLEAGP